MAVCLARFVRLSAAAVAMLAAPLAARAQQFAALTPPAGYETRAPIGWVDFCERNPADCQVPAMAAELVPLTAANWRTITRINTGVNRDIRAVSDKDLYGVTEHWTYPSAGKGDCEDIVLEKRRRLMQAGLPRQALLITVVRDLKGDGHAVLTVRTDRGDYILDNQEAKVLNWDETGYRFIKRQSETHPNTWISLGGIDTGSSVAGMMRR
ncbi:MAG TPA: transglutaminase-like cysteine peptidase [Beijerinckiaceae bacterium]|nr:transglutaminase-like cysteine peptidase [Beijerinckiaceae bacterium]